MDVESPPLGKYKKLRLALGDQESYFSCLVHENAVNFMNDPENAQKVGIGLCESGVLAHSLFPSEAVYPPVKIWLMNGSETALRVTLPAAPVEYLYDPSNDGPVNKSVEQVDTGTEEPFKSVEPEISNSEVFNTVSPPKKRADRKMTPKHMKVSSSPRDSTVNRSLTDYFGNESSISNVSVTNKVKVTDLPKDFEEKILLFELNRQLQKSKPDLYSRGSKSAIKLVSRCSTEAIVEFSSPEAVRHICEEVAVDYYDKLVFIEPFAFEENPSNKIHVTCLPDDYEDIILLYELNRQLQKSKPDLYSRGSKSAIKVVRQCSTEAIVEFVSPEAAKHMCDVSAVEYGVTQLELKNIPEERFSAADNETRNETPTPDRTLSKKVLVFGLPDDFSEKIVLHVFNTCLWGADKYPKTIKPAVRVVDKHLNEVTVEFISIEAARQVCHLPGIKYDGQLLVMEHLQEEADAVGDSSDLMDGGLRKLQIEEALSTSELAQLDALKRSFHIVISKLPANLDKDDFENYFRSQVAQAYNLDSESDWYEIAEFSYFPDKNSVVVKFVCSDQATFASRLHLHYRSIDLKIKKIVPINNNVCMPLSDDENEETDYVPLDHPHGLKVFMKLLARFKDDTPKSGSYDPLYEMMRPFLLKFGVVATVAEMRSKRSALRNAHRVRTRDGKLKHDLHLVSSVVFGTAERSVLRGTFFEWTASDEEKCTQEEEDPADKKIQDLIRLSEASSWTNNSTAALINACIAFKDDYDQPVRRPIFWRKISNSLFTKNYVYGPEKCRAKMGDLSKEYQDYADKGGQSGAEGPLQLINDKETRKIMTLMHELKRTDVTTNPRLVLGAGVRVVYKHLEEEHKERPSQTSGGITRPTVLKRIPTSKERQLKASETKAEALMSLSQTLKEMSSARK